MLPSAISFLFLVYLYCISDNTHVKTPITHAKREQQKKKAGQFIFFKSTFLSPITNSPFKICCYVIIAIPSPGGSILNIIYRNSDGMVLCASAKWSTLRFPFCSRFLDMITTFLLSRNQIKYLTIRLLFFKKTW
jgi:hypothetical protein